MISINERIRLILDRQKITNKDVAAWLGMTNSRLSQKFKEGIWDSVDELKVISKHTGVALFLEQGGRIEVLQDLMGHSDIDTTMVYAHISQTRKRTQKNETFDNIIPMESPETVNASKN